MTMTFIASYTAPAGGSGSAVFFNNIPQTFTHLQFRLSLRSGNTGTGAAVFIPGNAYHNLIGNGSTAASNGFSSVVNGIFNSIGNSSTANVFSSHILDILDYTNTNKAKTIRLIGGYDANGSGIVELFSTLLTSTAAISSWFFDVGGPNFFAAGSRFDLYGIGVSDQTGA